MLSATAATDAPTLTVTPTGFSISIDGGLVQTTSIGFGLWYVNNVAPTLSHGTLTYTYSNWTVALTPTADASAIHFSLQFTNTTTAPATVPDFTLCGLTGNLTQQWASNQAGPLVLDSTLSDGTHVALTDDDINYPIVAELMHADNVLDGNMNIYFHPSGGQYTSYDLGLTPLVIAPGASTTIDCSLRIGPTTAAVSAATDAAWAQMFPYSLDWTDRRQMLRGDLFELDPTTSNPEGCLCGFDINNPANFQAFETYAMDYATQAIATCKAADAGTWIEWDLEGKQDGFNYKGNPSLIMQLDPGWAQTDGTGVPLITRFIDAFQDAGVNFGVCVRPQTLAIDSNGNLYQDTSVSPVQSVTNQINYCESTWGLKVFYIDSPEPYQTAAYRQIAQSHPGTLLIPEDVPESWLQFSAPMVWLSGDNIDWGTVPRGIYGDLGWGVYFHQDLTNAAVAANFEADAELGSTVLTDNAWNGPDTAQIQAAVALLAAAAAANPAVPVVSVSDAGGAEDGDPFAASASASVYGVDLPTPALTYYLGSSATGTPLAGAPQDPGTYTVVASVAAGGEYAAASAETTFTITPTMAAVPTDDAVSAPVPPATASTNASSDASTSNAATTSTAAPRSSRARARATKPAPTRHPAPAAKTPAVRSFIQTLRETGQYAALNSFEASTDGGTNAAQLRFYFTSEAALNRSRRWMAARAA